MRRLGRTGAMVLGSSLVIASLACKEGAAPQEQRETTPARPAAARPAPAHPTDPTNDAPRIDRTDMFDQDGDPVEMNLYGKRRKPSAAERVVTLNTRTLHPCFDLARRRGIDLIRLTVTIVGSKSATLEQIHFQETRLPSPRAIQDEATARCFQETLARWTFDTTATTKYAFAYLLWDKEGRGNRAKHPGR